jgi:hypothetical protein
MLSFAQWLPAAFAAAPAPAEPNASISLTILQGQQSNFLISTFPIMKYI